MYKTENEFRQQEKIEPQCIVLTPWEEFAPSIESVIDHKRVVYEYDAMIRSLAESYRKNSAEPEDPDYDFETQAMEWISVNTIRSLPYWPEEFRPFVAVISKEELDEYWKNALDKYGKEITGLLDLVGFQKELAYARQENYDEFEQTLDELISRWLVYGK